MIEQSERSFQEISLRCKECYEIFKWTAGEQAFLHDLRADGKIDEVIQPKRCQPCRAKYKQRQADKERAQRFNVIDNDLEALGDDPNEWGMAK